MKTPTRKKKTTQMPKWLKQLIGYLLYADESSGRSIYYMVFEPMGYTSKESEKLIKIAKQKRIVITDSKDSAWWDSYFMLSKKAFERYKNKPEFTKIAEEYKQQENNERGVMPMPATSKPATKPVAKPKPVTPKRAQNQVKTNKKTISKKGFLHVC